MLSFKLSLALLAVAGVTLVNGATPPTIQLPHGAVAGNFETNSTITFPRPVAAYHSIPYVAAPVGELRFKHPQPPRKWSDTLNATKFGPVCAQASATPAWSEDCLTVDVFVPAGTEADAKLPVLLYIAGGLFVRGSGRAVDLAAMVAQSPKDFIAISFNYRVSSTSEAATREYLTLPRSHQIGALGFLPSELTQRANLLNLGWADQVAAIRWVNSNIHLFGGDASEVTLYGISAGAHSVG